MYKERMITRKGLAFVLLVLMALEVLLFSVSLTAFAAGEFVNLEQSDPREDLQKMGVNIAFFKKVGNADCQIVGFVENCYSENFSGQDRHYGLYVWVYNPTGSEIRSDGNNDINLSANGGASYENVDLKLLSHTPDNLIYKFRIEDVKITDLLADARTYAAEHEGVRSYKVAGVQLQEGTMLANDSKVGKEFIFTGYAKGCDESAKEEPTLTMKTAGLETIHLELHHATWRSGVGSGLKGWVQDAIHTAYFGLPKEYLDEYGNLQKIKAEWDEYKTKEIFATYDGNAFNALSPWRGVVLENGRSEELNYRILWDWYIPTSIDPNGVLSNATYFGRGYNDASNAKVGLDGIVYRYDSTYTSLSQFNWLFNITSKDDAVSSAELQDYMSNYPKNSAALAGGQFSLDLFESGIDTDRQEAFDADGDHHIVQEIDLDEKINDIKVPGPFWDRVFGDGTTTMQDLDPIIVIAGDDLTELKAWNAVNAEHVKAFEEKYRIENDSGDTGNVLRDLKKIAEEGLCPVLLRFAVTDYYCSSAYFDDIDESFEGIDGYVAKQTVFLNFDVVSLSFKTKDDGNNLVVIPVVADPINVIPSLIPPPVNEELDYLKFIVGLLLVVIIIFLFGDFVMPILEVIFNGVMNILGFALRLLLWLLGLPFKLIGRLFGSNRGR